MPTTPKGQNKDLGRNGDIGDAKQLSEVVHGLEELLGGFWFPYDKDLEPLPGHQVIAGFTRSPSGRQVLTGVFVFGNAVTSDDLRRVPIKELENKANLSNRSARRALERDITKLPPLKRELSANPDEFSQLVAKHYNAWSALVPHPAPAIAADQDVNVRTVHTWIREARLRGYITTTTRRKASRIDTT